MSTSESGWPSTRALAIAEARSSVGLLAARRGERREIAEELEQHLELFLECGAALQFVVVAAEHFLGQREHPGKVGLRQPQQRHDHVQRIIHRDLLDEVTLSDPATGVHHLVDVDLGQLVDADFERPHCLGAEPVRADRPDHPVLRVIHVDQGAQPHPGVQLLTRQVVGRRGGKQRPWLVDEQIIGPLDRHDVGMLGDRPERTVGRAVDQRHWCVGPKVGQRGVQPRFVGIGCRINEDACGLVNDRCVHQPSHLPGLLGAFFDTCQTQSR